MSWIDLRRPFANLFLHRVLYKSACLVLLPLAAVAGLAPGLLARYRHAPDGAGAPATSVAAAASAASAASATSTLTTALPGWRALPLSEVELRFARHFPGTLARLTDEHQVLVLREVRQPTRMLHPATDCYQALGYRIQAERLERDAQARVWRCFEATRGGTGTRLAVCERIEDAAGQSWTDTSAWYWSASLGQSHGPWRALTVARPL
jgi:hypothetical protein